MHYKCKHTKRIKTTKNHEGVKITITYFGLLAEVTQRSQETLEFTKKSVSELVDLLFEKYPGLKHQDFQVAQHQEIASRNDIVSDSEIALLPPFAGG